MLTTEQTITDTEHLAELQRTFAFIRDNGLLGRVISITPGRSDNYTRLHLDHLADVERLVGRKLVGARHGNSMVYNAVAGGFWLGCCVPVQEGE